MCCYSATVKHYLVFFTQRSYVLCFTLFMCLVCLTKGSSDVVMILWLVTIVSLSLLRAVFIRALRIRELENYTETAPNAFETHNRLELIMLEAENLPMEETWPGTEENTNFNENRPVSKALIMTLPHVNAIEPGNCCICLDEISLQQALTIMPCMHKFHSPCVDGWLLIKPSCPICKTRIN